MVRESVFSDSIASYSNAPIGLMVLEGDFAAGMALLSVNAIFELPAAGGFVEHNFPSQPPVGPDAGSLELFEGGVVAGIEASTMSVLPDGDMLVATHGSASTQTVAPLELHWRALLLLAFCAGCSVSIDPGAETFLCRDEPKTCPPDHICSNVIIEYSNATPIRRGFFSTSTIRSQASAFSPTRIPPTPRGSAAH